MTAIPCRSISSSGNRLFVFAYLAPWTEETICKSLLWTGIKRPFKLLFLPWLYNCKKKTHLKLKIRVQFFQDIERCIDMVWNFNKYDKFITKWKEVGFFSNWPLRLQEFVSLHSWWFHECAVSDRWGDSKSHIVTYFVWRKNENFKTGIKKCDMCRKSTTQASQC